MKPSFRLVLATLISTNVLVPNAFGQVSRQDFKLQVSQKVQSPQENAKMVQAWKAGTGSSTQPTVSNGESSTNLKIENKTKLQLGGNGVSGGGQSVVFADGTVRFMDLLTPEERPTSASQVMSWEQVRKVFFVSKPYVKQLARKVPNFFDCAKQVFQAHASESKAYTRVIPELEKAQVLDTEFQIMDFADNSDLQEFLAKYPAPIFTFASPTLPLEYQQAVAAYAHNQIWMNARLRARMNSQDQCALAVHEGLRLANSLDYFKQLLTTSEIEILTRHLMGVENVDQRNEMQAVVEKSQQVKPTAEEISAHEQEVMQQAAALNLELEKNV
ncbi:MAG TPA: hypothetical protein VN132_07415, partial [Bdellovibrio sp.]|nr:hypothetical protein [Bdellovibrio sp.]